MTVVALEPTVLPFLRGRLSALARRHQVPGAQLAIHQAGRTVAVEVGDAEHGTRQRMTAGTAVPIGSVTKSFTATTAMVLVADGDLDLDDPLGDHLPELCDLGGLLTLRQVLSHTAGLPAGPESEEVSTATPRRYVTDHCRVADLVLPPGTGFSYSNVGYVLVGRLIETVTGMGWWDAVESILLRPLGIEPAAIVGPGRGAADRPVAVGHSVNAMSGRVRPVRQSLVPAEAPAGGLAVSATDLVALGRLYVDPGRPDLLPAAQAARMWEPVAVADPFGLADGWGLGLAIFDTEGTRWIGHDGNADGTACCLRVDPVGGSVIGFTSNANAGMGLWRDLLAELARTGLRVPPARITTPPVRTAPPPSGCAGTYVNGGMAYVVSTGSGGALYLSVDGDAFVRLTIHDDLVFSYRDPSSGRQVIGGRFVPDPETGRVRAIQMDGRVAGRRIRPARDTAYRQIA